MARTYTRTKTIDGVEYTAKFCGLEYAMDLMDSVYIGDTRNRNSVELYKRVLSEIIVTPPGLSLDSFDNSETLNSVVKFGLEVAQGKFRDRQEKTEAKSA